MESGTIREKKGRHLQLHTKLLESREIRQTVGHAGPPDYKDVPMQRRPSFLMADTSRRVELDRDQNGVVGSLKIARIRVLLAPKMDPYVIPMHKVQSWEVSKVILNSGVVADEEPSRCWRCLRSCLATRLHVSICESPTARATKL